MTVNELVDELGADAEIAFLAGDMNAEPDTPAMSFLRGDAEHDGETGTLHDLWLDGGDDDDGFTSPAEAPARRIDFVYADRETTAPSCTRFVTDAIDGLWASDHLGVVCDVVW